MTTTNTTVPTILCFIQHLGPRQFTATVQLRDGMFSGDVGRTRRQAVENLNRKLVASGRGVPNWNIVESAPPMVQAPAEEQEAPAIEAAPPPFEVEEPEPKTTLYVPAAEPEATGFEPENRQPRGLLTPVEEPERWAAAYHFAATAVGEEGTPTDIALLMKTGGFASPWDRDRQDKPYHMYATNAHVRTPRKGEGEHRRLLNNNNYERDYQGRSPVEAGSKARETSALHPANEPERPARKSKAQQKAERAALPEHVKNASRAAYKAGSVASSAAKANGDQEGARTAYKLGYCAVLQSMGATADPKFAKFMADLGMTEVPAEWLTWAKTAKAA